MNREQWSRYLHSIAVDPNKKVSKLDFKLVMNDSIGELNVTDLQLQEGSYPTAPIPNITEMLEEVSFGINENSFLLTVNNSVKRGVQPINHEGCTNRFYNIVGRGHEVVSIPNIYHEDYKLELLTSGLDIELYTKEDFDLIRISTNEGAHSPERYSAHPALEFHPLNYRYTREFYLGAGLAGEKITLSCNQHRASIGDHNIMPIGDRSRSYGMIYPNFSRQRLMVAPFGSFRIRIEFYKLVEENLGTSEEPDMVTYFKDTGIGFYGIAEFNQVKEGAKI